MVRCITWCATLGVCALMSSLALRADVLFPLGTPDGRIALASRPASPGKMEIEAADDFITTTASTIIRATFTGLLPTGLALSNINFVGVELYRVFPADSVNPPGGSVPTRVNSPSDNAFASRDSTAGLTFIATIINPNFTAANSILNGINKIPGQTTGGEGPVTGEEVVINVTFTTPFVLGADHFFFKPEVGFMGMGDFYWLSTARPGPVFPGDLQAWIRNTALDPDWLRAGTDIVGPTAGQTFNGAFTLVAVPEPSTVALMFAGLAVVALKRRRG